METEEVASCSLKQTGRKAHRGLWTSGLSPGILRIPEAVYIVTSATFEKKKEVRNSFWIFQLSRCAFQGISSWYSFSSIRGEV